MEHDLKQDSIERVVIEFIALPTFLHSKTQIKDMLLHSMHIILNPRIFTIMGGCMIGCLQESLPFVVNVEGKPPPKVRCVG